MLAESTYLYPCLTLIWWMLNWENGKVNNPWLIRALIWEIAEKFWIFFKSLGQIFLTCYPTSQPALAARVANVVTLWLHLEAFKVLYQLLLTVSDNDILYAIQYFLLLFVFIVFPFFYVNMYERLCSSYFTTYFWLLPRGISTINK